MPDGTVRMLLVDDDNHHVERLRETFRGTPPHQFELVCAHGLPDARRKLHGDRWDIILLNVAACGGPALAVLALLQTYARDVPILALTPADCEPIALKAVRQGADDYLVSEHLYPIMLVRAIDHAIERRKRAVELRAADEALRASERRYRMLFERSRDAILIADGAGAIAQANDAAAGLFGLTRDELRGKELASLCWNASDASRAERELRANGGATELEIPMRRADGEPIWCLMSVASGAGEDGGAAGWQAIIHDITARKRFEDRLLHDALHDAVTGLPNRALFTDRLAQALERWRREPDRRFAVLFLDLDSFKLVNDSLGHLAGDAVLRRMADAMRSALRRQDTVARLGGDEFAILLDDAATDAAVLETARRLQERLEAPFELAGERVVVSASIGIAFPTRRDQLPADLLRDADLSMYRAKRGRSARHRPSAAPV